MPSDAQMRAIAQRKKKAQKKRSVTSHVYKGVSFYSSNGGRLSQKAQQDIVSAAKKVPDKVWKRLEEAGTRIIVMDPNDREMHPVMREYLLAAGAPPEHVNDLNDKNVTFQTVDRKPISIVSWGLPSKNPLGKPIDQSDYGYTSSPSHVLRHETAHTVDTGLGLMGAVASVFHDLERKTIRSVAQAHVIQNEARNEPLSVTGGKHPYSISSSQRFKESIPRGYTGGYGDPTRSFNRSTKYPDDEVFAEALARYWNREIIPKKMKRFFDDYFSDSNDLWRY